MTDIALTWDAADGAADFALSAGDLLSDDGLETAVLLSLFTDRRAEDGDVLPDGETDRRGWWADAFPVEDGDHFGSRLWQLARSKRTPETLRRAEEYAREALAWLLEDKVAGRVDVTAEALAGDILGLGVTIYRPTSDVAQYKFNYTWDAQALRSAS